MNSLARLRLPSSSFRHERTNHLQPSTSHHVRCCWQRSYITSLKRASSQHALRGLADDFLEPLATQQPSNPDPSLINEDFRPTNASERTFSSTDFAALWISLIISITTYYLAASLVDMGMSWWQGVATVFIGNVVTLVPMVLNAHPGTKYGIPFPVLARASYGIRGANVPSLLRALVACGWYGIQTWVGGSSLHQMIQALTSGALSTVPLPMLGISVSELACFGTFWLAQLAIIMRGIECITVVEKYSAPVLVGLAAALMAWAISTAGGFGPMLSTPSQFGAGMPRAGQFWSVFWPAVTANVGYWATLSLNIPDFTRYAKSQKDQLVGQALGLPTFMALFSFVGLAVTSATVVIFGQPITDPVQLLGRLEGPMAICFSLCGLMLATLTTNIAANVVGPANAFVNLAPSSISFTAGAVITATLSALIMPWNLVSSTQGFIYTWLVGYSALLGPVIGVVLTDYYLIRSRLLDVSHLYSTATGASYWYQGGFNMAALMATLLGVLPTMPGFLVAIGVLPSTAPFLKALYDCAWFVGTAVSSVIYFAMMKLQSSCEPGQAAAAAAT